MPRVQNNVASKRRRKKVLKYAKGYRGGKSKLYRTAKEAVEKALQYAYRDRRTKKRAFRRLWITRINAAVHQYSINYSQFMNGLKLADIKIDRKMLAEIAVNNSDDFARIVQIAKDELNRNSLQTA